MQTCALAASVQACTCTPSPGFPCCGCPWSARSPAAPHSLRGLTLVQNSSRSPTGTLRRGSPRVLPVPTPQHRAGRLRRCRAAPGSGTPGLGCCCFHSLQGLSSCYNLLCFFSTSFPADPFFVSVSLKLPGYPLILLVGIFHFKWPAWGKHAPDR